ncbi:MAG: response regulator [Elusimicrobia bacterium]|nr:response regulator [Elusimicrobiota bacterium]
MEKSAPKLKILIVDDDGVTRRVLVLALKGKGYEVLAAPGPVEGLELAVQEKPALIILDIYMPAMDGLAVLSQLRDNPETAKIPVLMLTAAEKMESIETSFELGANAYLPKPIHIERLQKKVAELLTPEPGRKP